MRGAVVGGRKPDRSVAEIVAYGLLVGVISGLGAWGFRLVIGLVHNVLFEGRLDLAYDANSHTPLAPWGAGIVLVPVLGSFVVTFLTERFAREARGHGVPEVVDAIYYGGGVIRPVVAVVKALASAVSIGSGGSVGREGPIVQIGATFGSMLGQRRTLSVTDRQLLIAAGSAGGIAATFNAPLGGVLFAVELLLVRVNARSLLVVGVATGVGVAVANVLLGSNLAFSVLSLETIASISVTPADGALLLVVGVLTGGIATAFIFGLYWTESRFERGFGNRYAAHAAGMLIVGLVIYGFARWLGHYSVQGVGYASITDILQGDQTAVGVLIALLAGKLLVTELTLGSGASGGVFSPSLFMGAAAGGALGHALAGAGVGTDPSLLAVAGMAGVVAGATGAVLTAVVMIGEMTGDFGATLPLILVAITANGVRTLVTPTTIYSEKLRRRGRWAPVGLQALAIDAVRARDLVDARRSPSELEHDAPRVGGNASLFEVTLALEEEGRGVVVTEGDAEIGVVTRESLAAAVRRLEGASSLR
ncbi:MAG: chloride channel protein [Dehalococcoidia bacterium]